MSNLIPPTPGRVVWYYPSQQEIDAKSITIIDQGQPMAATVAFVWYDRMVNLSVVDHAGAQFRRTSVRLLQEDDPTPHSSEGPYASWTPHQKGFVWLLSHEAIVDAVNGRFVATPDAAPCGGEWGACGATPNGGVDIAAPSADLTVETKVYTDGTSATGTAPLPEQSPAEQEAGESAPADEAADPA